MYLVTTIRKVMSSADTPEQTFENLVKPLKPVHLLTLYRLLPLNFKGTVHVNRNTYSIPLIKSIEIIASTSINRFFSVILYEHSTYLWL